MRRLISRFILKILGWKIVIPFDDFPNQYVIAVVPHTSNWDFPLGLLARRAMREDIKFVAKDSLFRFPLGWLFRALGGHPVDRSRSTNYVDSVAEIFTKEKEFRLCIAPEGTRSRVEKLKTGFYYIAKKAGVPILLCKFDFATRQVVIDQPFFPTDDVEADFRYIYDFFRGVRGKNPELGFLYDQAEKAGS